MTCYHSVGATWGYQIMNVVTEVLANRSSAEKRTLLVELLRELAHQSPAQAVSIHDDDGKLLGLFSPIANNIEADFFAEGSPGFFRELERRRQSKSLIGANEAVAYLESGAVPK